MSFTKTAMSSHWEDNIMIYEPLKEKSEKVYFLVISLKWREIEALVMDGDQLNIMNFGMAKHLIV